jgi:hypothetical protein
VGHAQERTLQEILQHQDKFSSARTNSMKRVVLTSIMEGGLIITGMALQRQNRVMENMTRLAARLETAMNRKTLPVFTLLNWMTQCRTSYQMMMIVYAPCFRSP